MNQNPVFSIGIDPGWKNLGLGIVQQIPGSYKSKLVYSTTLNPSSYESPEFFVEQALDDIIAVAIGGSYLKNVKHFTIERYVAYANVKTSETENITSLIGMMSLYAYQASLSFGKDDHPLDRTLVRAIEWKVGIAQLLAKHTTFRNPSTQLDKKFSIAVAKELIDGNGKFETDHEADAIALAAIPFAREVLLLKSS